MAHLIIRAVSRARSPLNFWRIAFLSSFSVAWLYWVARSSLRSWRALGFCWRYTLLAAFRCHLAWSNVTLSGAKTPTAFANHLIRERLRRFPCFKATTMFQSRSLPPSVLRRLEYGTSPMRSFRHLSSAARMHAVLSSSSAICCCTSVGVADVECSVSL